MKCKLQRYDTEAEAQSAARIHNATEAWKITSFWCFGCRAFHASREGWNYPQQKAKGSK